MSDNWVPLRDREDLPNDIRGVLSIRRHVENDVLVIAHWVGFFPSEPWPGSTGIAWRGVCSARRSPTRQGRGAMLRLCSTDEWDAHTMDEGRRTGD